jgi:hypothetical protein
VDKNTGGKSEKRENEERLNCEVGKKEEKANGRKT